MGRPRKEIDPRQVEKLAALGCTMDEIASVVGCTKRTLERRFVAEIDKGRQSVKTRIRRWQLRAARGGNVAMLIWLGKQLLGQSDKIDTNNNVTGNGVILVLPDNGRGDISTTED